MPRQRITIGVSLVIVVLLAVAGYRLLNAGTFASPVFVSNLDTNRLTRIKKIDLTFEPGKLAASYREEGMPWLLPLEFNTSLLDSESMPVMIKDSIGHRNPVQVSNAAFYFHGRYLQSRDERDKEAFLRNVRWLEQNHRRGYYHYPFDWKHYGATKTGGLLIVELDSGWVSGMAQGQALGALALAFDMSGDQSFLAAARDVFRTLRINEDPHWVFALDENGYYWIEEYPNSDFCHVLNGSLFALWGLWNYHVVTHNPIALTLFRAGVRSIADHVGNWNIKGADNSLYCRHRVESKGYHAIAIEQLNIYARHFNLPQLASAARSFRR